MNIYKYDVILLDLDGVVYLGNQVLPGSRECIERLRKRGKQIYFLTNDPRPTRQELCERLQSMQITAVPEEIITSGWATANYLAENNILHVFVIGTKGLIDELTAQGIRVNTDDECQAVIIGYDDNASFCQIQQAVRFINKGARFIATNTEDISRAGRAMCGNRDNC
jgi:HAD superfamily hydrolase (TIGR01450 family)